ncbi:MAG: hypothetical protein ACREPM_12290 [Gemmatimonadaceae bacterium]
MSSSSSTMYDAAWSIIDKERKRDRTVRRVSVIAWGITLVALLAFAAISTQHILIVRKNLAVGVVAPGALYDAALPLIAVVGVLSTLVATLSTVGIFLRLRTASLSEIQLRLATLEEVLRTGAPTLLRVRGEESSSSKPEAQTSGEPQRNDR